MYIALCFHFTSIILKLLPSPPPDFSNRTPRNILELKSSDQLSGSTLQRVENFFRDALFRLLYYPWKREHNRRLPESSLFFIGNCR